jgi:hypothetical protein
MAWRDLAFNDAGELRPAPAVGFLALLFGPPILLPLILDVSFSYGLLFAIVWGVVLDRFRRLLGW